MSDRCEKVRHEILLQCYGYRPQARDAARMARTARMEGEIPDAAAPEFEREAAYLVDKGLLRRVTDEIARGRRRYALTAAGVDYLEEHDLL